MTIAVMSGMSKERTGRYEHGEFDLFAPLTFIYVLYLCHAEHVRCIVLVPVATSDVLWIVSRSRSHPCGSTSGLEYVEVDRLHALSSSHITQEKQARAWCSAVGACWLES